MCSSRTADASDAVINEIGNPSSPVFLDMKVIATSLLIALFVQSYICFGSATAQEIDYMDEDLFDELESSEV